jgi:hypothetical protein
MCPSCDMNMMFKCLSWNVKYRRTLLLRSRNLHFPAIYNIFWGPFNFPKCTMYFKPFPTIYIIFTWLLQMGKRGVHFYCSLKMMTQTTSIKLCERALQCETQHNNQTNISCVIIIMAVYRIKASWIHVFIKIMNYIWLNYNSVKVPGELLQHTHTLCFNTW